MWLSGSVAAVLLGMAGHSALADNLVAAEEETNASALDCPKPTEEEEHNMLVFSWWCEGVILCAVSVAGLFGNTVSSVILSAKSMRNSFNLLLIALAIYDNVYLVGAILEAFRKKFDLITELHILMFPYFLYPLHMMAMTGSILMTVAIALERYVAVHYPINYSQTMNDSRALRIRLLKYLLPVVVLSVVMNITKFFEIEIGYEPVFPPDDNATATALSPTESVPMRPMLNVTDFRKDPTYSIYFNFFRFVSIGVVPFALLVFFNARIYVDLRRRGRMRRGMSAAGHVGRSVNTVNAVNATSKAMAAAAAATTDKKSRSRMPPTLRKCFLVTKKQSADVGALTGDEPALKDQTETEVLPLIESAQDTKGTNSPALNLVQQRNGQSDNTGNGSAQSQNCAIITTTTAVNVRPPSPDGISNCAETTLATTVRTTTVKTRPVPAAGQPTDSNDARRRVESNLALIMMGYVLVFLVCHSPRLMLNIYELANIREAMKCQKAGEHPFPMWSLVVMNISHLMLVANSSINILIYCCLSSKFREEGSLLMVRTLNFFKTCCGRSCKNQDQF